MVTQAEMGRSVWPDFALKSTAFTWTAGILDNILYYIVQNILINLISVIIRLTPPLEQRKYVPQQSKHYINGDGLYIFGITSVDYDRHLIEMWLRVEDEVLWILRLICGSFTH